MALKNGLTVPEKIVFALGSPGRKDSDKGSRNKTKLSLRNLCLLILLSGWYVSGPSLAPNMLHPIQP